METKLITFANLKGGATKSTHAAALAAGLLEQGKSVLILELDEQGTAESWAMAAAEKNNQLSVRYLDLKDMELTDAHDAILEQCKDVDFVIADTPGNATTGLTAALITSDVVFIPFMLTDPDIRGVHRTHELLLAGLDSLNAEQEGFNNFCLLYVKENSFISNERNVALQTLAETFFVRAGLPRNPVLADWMKTGVTPNQLMAMFDSKSDKKHMKQLGMSLKQAERSKELIDQLTGNLTEIINA